MARLSTISLFSLTAAAAVAGITIPRANGSCTSPEVRKEWRELSSEEKAEYIRALAPLVYKTARGLVRASPTSPQYLLRCLSPSPGVLGPDSRFCLFVAHYAFYQMGKSFDALGRKYSEREERRTFSTTVSSLGLSVLPLGLRDGCYCACSNSPCTPITYMLKGMYGVREQKSLDEVGKEIQKLFSMSSNDVKMAFLPPFIRFCSFEALGITHTCCDPADPVPHDSSGCDDRNPEQGWLEILEQLVVEFEDIAYSMLADVSSLETFWTEYWPGRTQYELDMLNGDNLSDDERANAEEVGVQGQETIKGRSKLFIKRWRLPTGRCRSRGRYNFTRQLWPHQLRTGRRYT